ncbi:hypothetical protein [Anaeromyxobacter terrae]|uniref:hypothetical protein n=1 Tax=Anaeromyxobacter terrae TaxID=2925406 RepID=UPI001F59F47A|nr:hypothetical protein [Anaeromyxobacter sp. SG22]
MDFVRDQLGHISGDEAELIDEIRDGLLDFTAMVKARRDAITENLKKATSVRSCSNCAQDALMLGAGDVHCAFCARKLSAEDAAEEYLGLLGYSRYDAMREGGAWPLHTCPDCESDALVEEEGGYVCFSCGGETDHFFKCMTCGALYKDGEQGVVCSECFDAAVADDD